MEKAKLPIIQTLHLLCEELQFYESANKERLDLSNLILELAVAAQKFEYI